MVGGVAALVLLATQARVEEGVEGLLQVGEYSRLRPLIEEELGSVPLATGSGHDGHIYYAVGLDLDADIVPTFLHDDAHRYRRILYPAVASLGGLLRGHALLYSMIAVTVVSAAAAAGAMAATAVAWNRSEWLALAVVFNPGVWLSIRLLTADMLALALMIVVLSLAVRQPLKAGFAVALMVFAKDVHGATALGLAADGRPDRWRPFLAPVALLAAWSLWLEFDLGNTMYAAGNLSLPLLGVIKAAPEWWGAEVKEWLYLAFALGSMVAGLITVMRRKSWLRWTIVAWLGLGLVSSDWVWRFGNNAARALAPLAVLIAFSYIPIGWDDSSSDALEDVATPT